MYFRLTPSRPQGTSNCSIEGTVHKVLLGCLVNNVILGRLVGCHEQGCRIQLSASAFRPCPPGLGSIFARYRDVIAVTALLWLELPVSTCTSYTVQHFLFVLAVSMQEPTERHPLIPATLTSKSGDDSRQVGPLEISRTTRYGILAGIWAATFLSVGWIKLKFDFNAKLIYTGWPERLWTVRYVFKCIRLIELRCANPATLVATC